MRGDTKKYYGFPVIGRIRKSSELQPKNTLLENKLSGIVIVHFTVFFFFSSLLIDFEY